MNKKPNKFVISASSTTTTLSDDICPPGVKGTLFVLSQEEQREDLAKDGGCFGWLILLPFIECKRFKLTLVGSHQPVQDWECFKLGKRLSELARRYLR